MDASGGLTFGSFRHQSMNQKKCLLLFTGGLAAPAAGFTSTPTQFHAAALVPKPSKFMVTAVPEGDVSAALCAERREIWSASCSASSVSVDEGKPKAFQSVAQPNPRELFTVEV